MNDKEDECKECLEQARLLGIGAEREAELLGKLERERALADRLAKNIDREIQCFFIEQAKLAIAAQKEARSE